MNLVQISSKLTDEGNGLGYAVCINLTVYKFRRFVVLHDCFACPFHISHLEDEYDGGEKGCCLCRG